MHTIFLPVSCRTDCFFVPLISVHLVVNCYKMEPHCLSLLAYCAVQIVFALFFLQRIHYRLQHVTVSNKKPKALYSLALNGGIFLSK